MLDRRTYTMNYRTTFISRGSLLLGFLALITAWSALSRTVTAQDACSDDDNTIRTTYSLYYEDYKNKSYETALPYLRWILSCKPGFPSNSDRNFRRAVEVYEGIGMDQSDSAMMRTYLDSSLYIFDTAVATLKDAGIEADSFKWIFDKARFIQNHAAELEDLQTEVGDLYRQAFDLDPKRLQQYYLNYIITDYLQKDRKSDAIEFIDSVEKNYPDDEAINTMLDQWRGSLFTSPEERIAFLEDQLAKKGDNAEIMSELFDLFAEEGLRSKLYDLGEKLLELSPTGRTYRQIAKMRLDDGEADEAISLYQKSLEMEGGQDAAREVYFNIGTAHQQQGRYSRARTSFRRSLQVDPKFGRALMAIGDLYVTAVQSCGSFEREDRAVYWLAADYFERAAARDSKIASQARQRARGLRKFFPTAEDKFFKNWKTGDSYRIDYGCYTWIGETTKIR
jgi:tetratricopeptide (TPR) repeat protein